MSRDEGIVKYAPLPKNPAEARFFRTTATPRRLRSAPLLTMSASASSQQQVRAFQFDNVREMALTLRVFQQHVVLFSFEIYLDAIENGQTPGQRRRPGGYRAWEEETLRTSAWLWYIHSGSGPR
jgi:hypothetical protein